MKEDSYTKKYLIRGFYLGAIVSLVIFNISIQLKRGSCLSIFDELDCYWKSLFAFFPWEISSILFFSLAGWIMGKLRDIKN